MSTASLLQSLTSAPIWTLLADLPLTAKQEKIRPAAARKGQPRGSFAIPTPFRASSNKLVHAAPQYLRYFLDGQHTGFYVTIFPAADILDPASDGLGKLSLGHACSLTGSLSFISHFYPSFCSSTFCSLLRGMLLPHSPDIPDNMSYTAYLQELFYGTTSSFGISGGILHA